MIASGRSRQAADQTSGGLEQVYLASRPALLRFLRARGAGDAAEDIVQQLWIKLSEGGSGPIRDPLAYLYRAANNLMIDRQRSQTGRVRREQDWSGLADGTAAAAPPVPSGEDEAIAREELAATDAALQALGERTDAIFRRFRLEGASQRQIAEDFGISLSAVEKHLQKAYRALVQVRRQLDAD